MDIQNTEKNNNTKAVVIFILAILVVLAILAYLMISMGKKTDTDNGAKNGTSGIDSAKSDSLGSNQKSENSGNNSDFSDNLSSDESFGVPPSGGGIEDYDDVAPNDSIGDFPDVPDPRETLDDGAEIAPIQEQ
ncbi:MAG: hypothetical protein PHH24_00575 [Candidatus Moranbacteria bacterium]|jgi:hypothetical protein|nr:hypothetical protein [Candidatus Moranbacteria bacterium]MDD5652210.1 hypothetical protein [Candidatus Moranbacteria bacterium]MDX9855755.1 hypothetical protein [Candidatus Moranbacteria bacterium]